MNVYDLLGGSTGSVHPDSQTPASGVARFWRLRGKRVVEAGGVHWGHYKGPFYLSLPFHLQIDPQPGEIEAILRRHRIPAVWFPSANHAGLECGKYVCRPQGYDLHAIDRRKRRQVQQGLDNCVVRPVNLEELRVEGMQLNRETMARQRRYDPEFGDRARWSRLVDAVGQCPEMSVMGAYVNGRLSAYMVGCREDGWLHLLYKMSRIEEMSEFTNAALDYTVLENAGRDPSLRAVGNWFASFMSNPGLDRYKRQMGYSVEPCQMCVCFHPAAAPLLANPMTVRVFQSASSFLSSNKPLESIARMFRGAMISRSQHDKGGADADSHCQQETSLRFSRMLRPYPVFLAWRFFDRLKAEGLRQAIARVVRFSSRRILRSAGARKTGTRKAVEPAEALGLQPGEWVEVRPEAEILSTLDAQSRHRGLLFSIEMRRFCGRRFRVLKPVRKIFLEESRQTRTLKNTVLLEGANCEGTGFDCDRACFLFWRETWLRRVPAPRDAEDRFVQITVAGD